MTEIEVHEPLSIEKRIENAILAIVDHFVLYLSVPITTEIKKKIVKWIKENEELTRLLLYRIYVELKDLFEE